MENMKYYYMTGEGQKESDFIEYENIQELANEHYNGDINKALDDTMYVFDKDEYEAWINKSLDELGDVIRVETDSIMQVEKFFVEEYSNHTEVEFCSKQFLVQYAKYKSIPAKERKNHESRFFEIKIKDVSIWFDIEFIKDMDDIFNLSESKLYASNSKQALFIESDFGIYIKSIDI